MRFAEQWSWCTVDDIRDVTPTIREFRLRPDNGQVAPCPPGSHIGVALGDLQLLSLRPFSRTPVGAIGDVINIAARLSTFAKPGQVVVSNLVYRKLSDDSQRFLRETEPVEAKNVGNIKAWMYDGTH